MRTSRKIVGDMGESAVCEKLISLGHSILERNWRTGKLEIDIISLAPDGLHFVEVKSRVVPTAADPQENVGYSKQANISRAAQKYLQKNAGEFADKEVWLDVASVVFDHDNVTIDYFPAAYIPIFV